MGVMAAGFPIASGVTQCHAFHPIAISFSFLHPFILPTRTMVSHA